MEERVINGHGQNELKTSRFVQQVAKSCRDEMEDEKDKVEGYLRSPNALWISPRKEVTVQMLGLALSIKLGEQWLQLRSLNLVEGLKIQRSTARDEQQLKMLYSSSMTSFHWSKRNRFLHYNPFA